MTKAIARTVVLILFISGSLFAQERKVDSIILLSGQEVNAVITEVLPTEIKYQDAGNSSGPLTVMPKRLIKEIIYSNGTKEVFNSEAENGNSLKPNPSSGRAYQVYKGRLSDDPSAKEYTIEDLGNESTPTIFYGLDFTQAKLIGASGFRDPDIIVSKYFAGINEKMVLESRKFDFGKILKTRYYDVDLDMLMQVNASVSTIDLVVNNNYRLEDGTIDQLVNSYNPKQQEGIGLVIVVESLNKIRERGVFHFTLFDVKTKQVLRKVKVEGECGGMGFTNYWMNSVHKTLKEARRKL